MARLRQAVVAARDLEATADRFRRELGLGDPFSDPAVAYFGLRNAVFAIGDQFLEVVSPVQPDTAASRLLDRRGGDCGYMAMFQVDDLRLARERAGELGIREVFEVELDDIAEAHLHPADMRGAIVSVSAPVPPKSWRWGGPGWPARSVAGAISGVTVAVADPVAARERWAAVAEGAPGAEFVVDEEERGIIEIRIERDGRTRTIAP